MPADSIKEVGPAVVQLAERHGLTVVAPQLGDRLTGGQPVDWSSIGARARRCTQALRATLDDSIKSVNEADDRAQILDGFASRVGGSGQRFTRYTVTPRPLGDLRFPVPDRAALPDLSHTLRELRHPRPEHRGMAAFRLGGHPATASTVRALRDRLAQDPDAHVRATAGKSLALLGDVSAFEVLRALLLEDRLQLANSDMVETFATAAHALVILTGHDNARVGDVAQLLATIGPHSSADLRSRLSELEALLFRAR